MGISNLTVQKIQILCISFYFPLNLKLINTVRTGCRTVGLIVGGISLVLTHIIMHHFIYLVLHVIQNIVIFTFRSREHPAELT